MQLYLGREHRPNPHLIEGPDPVRRGRARRHGLDRLDAEGSGPSFA